jgi:parallel beta-helix repeat protein
LKKKLLVTFLILIIGLLYFEIKIPSMPSYMPEREYLDMEIPILEAFITAKDSSMIELPEGHYLFSQSLIMDGKKNVTIRGAGIEKTVLSFKGQKQGAEGVRISNCNNITIENLSIEDAAGDNLKVTDSDSVVMRNIRSAWTGKVSTENGAYALYPVLCNNLLIEGCEAIGSSDAGIYVGQSKNVIIRNNKAYYNVAGIESENSSQVEIYDNEIFNNTGGLLIFNLPHLTVYGENVKAYNNHIYDNNIKNFGVKGSIVSTVPRGTGIIVMATKEVAIYENKIENHKTINASVVSYEIYVPPKNKKKKKKKPLRNGLRQVEEDYIEDISYSAYPGRVSIHDNKFKNKYFIPALDNDFGLLWIMKNKLQIPDIAYDAILPSNYLLENRTPNPEYKICVKNNGKINFVAMDAGNDFEKFSNDLDDYECDVEFEL